MTDIDVIFDSLPRELPLAAVLETLSGEPIDPDVARVWADRAREIEPQLLDWLGQNPDQIQRFGQDPASVLRTVFPELELPPIKPGTFPTRDLVGMPRKLHVRVPPSPSPALGLLAAVWEWIAASQQHTDEFVVGQANTNSVYTGLSTLVQNIGGQTGATQDVINQVVQALDTVLNIPFVPRYEPVLLGVSKAIFTGEVR